MEHNKLQNIASKIANIATGLETKVFYFLSVATLSTILVTWQWLDFSPIGFVLILKTVLLALPVLCWFLFWLLIKELTGLPEQVSELKNLGQTSINTIANIRQGTAKKKSIFGHLFQLISTLREPEILETLLLCSKGAGWLINPFTWFALLFSALVIFGYILVAILTLIF